MKVYLDTNIVSCMINNDLIEEEINAIEQILSFWDSGVIEIRTSKITEDELKNIPVESKSNHLALYKLIRKVPLIPEATTNSGLLLMGVGGGTREDPLYTQIKTILELNDAKHMFQAIKNNMDIFLTADKKIINKNNMIKPLSMIEIVKPTQLFQRLSDTTTTSASP